jgi:prepilin-type N-terminal cleavage/methylation domain-containing protein
MKTHKGFSLVELIVVIVLVGIIAGVLSYLLSKGFTSYYFAQSTYNQVESANIAINRMAKELKRGILITQATSTQVTFTNYDGNSIRYALSGNLLRRRLNTGSNFTILNNVTAFSLSYTDNNFNTTASAASASIVTISLTVEENNISYQLMTTVSLRNYV